MLSFRWAKYKDIKNASFIRDNILLLGGDNALTFVNLNDGSSTVQNITEKIGNGVTCFVGHKLYDIFAFSGAWINPKIILYSHPDLKLVSCFQSKSFVFSAVCVIWLIAYRIWWCTLHCNEIL